MPARPQRSLELVTPSYAPDFELCRDLVSSVARFAPPGTVHRVLVPRQDLSRFGGLARLGDVVVQPVDEFIPQSFRKIPAVNAWLSLRRPWPPVRGWIVQQIVKLAASAAAETDGVLLVDSDIVFVRDFTWADFAADQQITLYRLDGAVHPGMKKHLIWDDTARRLLGLPARAEGNAPDYIAWPCLWFPALVRDLLQEVEQRSGRSWDVAIGGELNFSEMVLYGVYVDAVRGAGAGLHHRSSMPCRVHHEERPLSPMELDHLMQSLTADDAAVMVSAKSGTLLQDRRDALQRLWGTAAT